MAATLALRPAPLRTQARASAPSSALRLRAAAPVPLARRSTPLRFAATVAAARGAGKAAPAAAVARRVSCAASAAAAAAQPASTDLVEQVTEVLSAAIIRSAGACALLAAAALVTHPFGRPVACLAFGAAIGHTGYKSGSLSKDGAVAAAIAGAATLSASYPCACLLLSFYLTSSKLTEMGAARKAALEADYKGKGGKRTAWQVAANAGVPTVLAVAHAAAEGGPDAAPLAAAVLAFFACCCGDTWASEIGVLSSDKPKLITTGAEVPAGTNGGVTALGLAASAAGGAFMGLVWMITSAVGGGAGGVPAPTLRWSLLLGIAAGLGGSLIDSLLGATVQYSGQDKAGKIYNKPVKGMELTRISGKDWITNGTVNVLSATLTAVLALTIIASFP